MRLVVIESPYSGDRSAAPEIQKQQVARNERYAERALLDCLRRGESPIASHLLFTRAGVLNDTLAEERSLGMRAGHSWIKKADCVVSYRDYGQSDGMRAGEAQAIKQRIPIEYRYIGTNESPKE